MRPATAEAITVDITPFFWSGNVPTYGGSYEQQTFNTWRAEWIDGTGQPAYAAQRDASGRTIDRPVSFASSAPDRLLPAGTAIAS